jgi:lysophospholipase L1-like esterase
MLRRIACVIVATTVALGALADPASAADDTADRHGTPRYLALGDSLAFGSQPTRVFDQGYVQQLYASLHARDPRLALTNLGCPGETSASLVAGGKCPYPGGGSQLDTALAFLRAHRGSVRLVTIDIGGNDVNGCVSFATGIDEACFRQGLLTIAINLFVTAAKLRQAAPGVKIAGMTYYDTVLAAWLTGPAGQALAKASLPMIHQLNGLLTIIYRLGRFQVADVAGAFSTDDMTTLVNGVPLDVARICQWTWMCAPKPLGPDIHANTAGYGVIAKAFEAVL